MIFSNTEYIMKQSTCRSSRGNIEQNCGKFILTLFFLLLSFPRFLLNSTGLRIDPWATLLVTDLQLVFVLLITTWSARQFSFQLTSPSIHLACISSFCLWGCCRRYCQKPSFNHQASYLVLVKHDFPFIQTCWLLPDISHLLLLCLEMG